MVDFRDPTRAQEDYLVLKKLYPITNGIYLWEYFTALDYEIDIIRGRRPYRWTAWIYSLSRAATLMAVILNFVDLTTTTAIHCQVWITFELTFGYLGLSAASFLIILRIIAIWNRNKIVVTTVTGLWVISVAVMIQGIARLRSDWSPVLPGCVILNSDSNKLNIIVGFISDLVFLFTMLLGLRRLRNDGGGKFGMGLLLWKQGVLWLLLVTVAEVPPTVLFILNLNDPLNLIFLLPSLITMTIGATRMHRSLTAFATSTTESNSTVSKLRWNQTPCNQIEGTVDTLYERHEMSRMSNHDAHINTREQPCDKAPV